MMATVRRYIPQGMHMERRSGRGGGRPVHHCHASKTLAPARARNIRCSSPSPAWPRRLRRGSALGSTTRGRAFPVLALPKQTAPSGYEANRNIVGDRAPSRQTARAGANFNQNGYQAMVCASLLFDNENILQEDQFKNFLEYSKHLEQFFTNKLQY